MLTYLTTIQPWQLALLYKSGEKGGITPAEIVDNITSGRWMVFKVREWGVLAVSVHGDEFNRSLTVEALAVPSFGWFMREFRNCLDKLATDWGCHTVDTMCFDSRLAAAMVKIEARPIAWQMQWQVKGMEASYGREN